MTWTTPKTWSGSEVLTAADMNEQVSGNVDHLYGYCPNTQGFKNTGTIFVSQLNQRIESGVEYFGLTTEAYGSKTVTFNTAFGTAPRVVASVDSSVLIAAPNSVGTGTFKLYIRTGSGGTTTGSYFPNWIAIGA